MSVCCQSLETNSRIKPEATVPCVLKYFLDIFIFIPNLVIFDSRKILRMKVNYSLMLYSAVSKKVNFQ